MNYHGNAPVPTSRLPPHRRVPRAASLVRLAIPLCACLLAVACSGPTVAAFTFSTDGASRTGLLALPEGAVVAGNEAGALVKLDREGAVVWRLATGREVAARPVLVGEVVVAVNLGGTAFGVSASDGTERWRISGLSPVTTALSTDGTRVFVVGTDGSVRALDPLSGATRWNRPGPALLRGQPAQRFPAPSASNERLVVALREAGVWSLSPADGAPQWRVAALDAADLVVDRGRVLAAERGGTLWALDETSGALLWKRELGSPVSGGLGSLGDGLCVGLLPHALAVLNVGSGVPSATLELPGPMVAPPARMGSLWLVPTAAGSGVLVGVRPGSGGVEFETRLDSPLRSAPVVDGDRVTVIASDGRVVSLRVRAAH